MNKQRVQIEQIQDQVWAGLRGFIVDIERIAEHGPDGSERDKDIVKMVFYAVGGKIRLDTATAVGS